MLFEIYLKAVYALCKRSLKLFIALHFPLRLSEAKSFARKPVKSSVQSSSSSFNEFLALNGIKKRFNCNFIVYTVKRKLISGEKQFRPFFQAQIMKSSIFYKHFKVENVVNSS